MLSFFTRWHSDPKTYHVPLMVSVLSSFLIFAINSKSWICNIHTSGYKHFLSTRPMCYVLNVIDLKDVIEVYSHCQKHVTCSRYIFSDPSYSMEAAGKVLMHAQLYKCKLLIWSCWQIIEDNFLWDSIPSHYSVCPANTPTSDLMQLVYMWNDFHLLPIWTQELSIKYFCHSDWISFRFVMGFNIFTNFSIW